MCSNSCSPKDLICFLKTLGPETFKTGAAAERAVSPWNMLAPPGALPVFLRRTRVALPLPNSAWQCSLHSLLWTLLFLSDLLSNCYFVMSCVSLLKKRAESNPGAGSISIFLFLVGQGKESWELPPRVSKVGERGELVLRLWPLAQN